MFHNFARIILCVSVIFLASCLQGSVETNEVSAGVEVGQEAPNFSLKDTEGNSVTLKGLRGEKIVVLDFWASWYPPCRKAIPELNKIQENYAENDVQVLGINIREKPAKVVGFKKKLMMKYPTLMDPKGVVAKNYGVEGIPNIILIDKGGIVRFNGHIPSRMEKALKELMK